MILVVLRWERDGRERRAGNNSPAPAWLLGWWLAGCCRWLACGALAMPLITEISSSPAPSPSPSVRAPGVDCAATPVSNDMAAAAAKGNSAEKMSNPFLPWADDNNAGKCDQAKPDGGNGTGAGEDAVDFIRADKFEGAKRAFIFKVGGQGLGYYRDGSTACAAPSASHTAPVRTRAILPCDPGSASFKRLVAP